MTILRRAYLFVWAATALACQTASVEPCSTAASAGPFDAAFRLADASPSVATARSAEAPPSPSASVPNTAVSLGRPLGIRAFLIHEESGRVGTQDIVGGELVLWNVIIGGGDVGKPSNSTLVFVDVSKTDHWSPSTTEQQGTLRLRATAGGRLLRDHSVALRRFFSRDASLSVPFLVYGTGCEELRLDATLQLPGRRETLTRRVPFQLNSLFLGKRAANKWTGRES